MYEEGRRLMELNACLSQTRANVLLNEIVDNIENEYEVRAVPSPSFAMPYIDDIWYFPERSILKSERLNKTGNTAL